MSVSKQNIKRRVALRSRTKKIKQAAKDLNVRLSAKVKMLESALINQRKLNQRLLESEEE